MKTNEPSAVAVFDDLEHAERGIHELEQAGFSTNEIGVIGHVGSNQQAVPTPPEVTHSEVYATSGVLKGGIWGAIVGLLVIGIIPGIGGVSGAGRWFEILAGAALGAAAGGALFAFGSLVLYRPQARYLEGELKKGHFIITVANPDRSAEAVSLLRQQGAIADPGPVSHSERTRAVGRET
jgi:heat induced stress protein YflT